MAIALPVDRLSIGPRVYVSRIAVAPNNAKKDIYNPPTLTISHACIASIGHVASAAIDSGAILIVLCSRRRCNWFSHGARPPAVTLVRPRNKNNYEGTCLELYPHCESGVDKLQMPGLGEKKKHMSQKPEGRDNLALEEE